MKISVNKSKSDALKQMALISLDRLKEMNLEKYPSNTLIDFYDIIHKLLEALSLKEGIKFRGEGAHYELINHVCDKYLLFEKDRVFLQSLREYRNRISYEGFMIKENYIANNKEKFYLLVDKLLSFL